VVVDADQGVSLDAAAEISRAISQRLDDSGADDPTGSLPYTLEVTSPGIGRPLTMPRHFRRARTRLVSLVTVDGRELSGHVLEVTDTAVRLVVSGKKGISEVEVPFTGIDRAKVEVEFSRPPAAVLELLGVDAAADADARSDEVDDDPAFDDPGLDDPGLDGSALDGSALDDPGRDEAALDDPALDDPGLDDPGLDEVELGDAATTGATPGVTR
jgi:ribosome maturation factor RimP